MLDALKAGTIPWRQPCIATHGIAPRSLHTRRPYRGRAAADWAVSPLVAWRLARLRHCIVTGPEQRGEPSGGHLVYVDLHAVSLLRRLSGIS